MSALNISPETVLQQLMEAPALFRVGAFLGVWGLLWLPLAVPLAIALHWHPPQPVTAAQKLPLVASLYLLAPLVLWATTTFPERSFAAYGLFWRGPESLSALGVGLLLGGLGIAIMFGVQMSLGWVQWQPQAETTIQTWGITLLSTLGLGLWVSLTEEVIFRGFLLNELSRDYPLGVAAAIASLIFAVLHLVWEGKANLPQLPGLWLMGLVLTLARGVNQGNLELAIGLHAGWIWAIATLDTLQVWHYTGKGSPWWVGWGNQPLAGLVGLTFLVATGGVLWGMVAH